MNADTASRDARLAAGEVLDYERVDGMCDGVPADYAAEDALLVAVLKRPAVLDGLDLEPRDFWGLRYRVCWSALLRLHRRGETVDFVTLVQAMGYEDAGALVADLWQTNGLSGDVRVYLERIKMMAFRRRLIDAAHHLAADAWDTSEPLDAAVARVKRRLTVPVGIEDAVIG